MTNENLDGLPPLEIVESDEEQTAESLGIELPEDQDEAIAYLLARLAESQREADSYLDDLRRVAADFDNYRKRAQRDQSSLMDRAAERLVTALLPALDGLDNAFSLEAQTPNEEKLLDGLRSTRDLLLAILQREGLAPIPAWQEEFDPNLHEAVAGPTEGDGRLFVSRELRRGYTFKGKVLRAAMVEVERET